MQLRQVDRCPAKLERGEYKRVPLRGPMIGVFLACPVCGYRCITILADELGATDPDGRLTVRDMVQCLICPKPAQITNGELVFADA